MAVTVATVDGSQLHTSARRVAPGWYHVVVTQCKETDSMNGVNIHGDALAGKPDQPSDAEIAGSTFQLTFWLPDMSRSQQEQDRTNAKLTAMLIALDLITPAMLGQPINFEPEHAVGRHCLIHVRYKQKKIEENGQEKWVDDTRYIDLAFNDILHVDDPAGANVPKNVNALKYIPAQLRHTDKSYFAFKAKPGSEPPPAVGGSVPAAGGNPPSAAPARKF